ncbi:class I SAM-dependent methyltransferase [Heyndrickxia oleronia]|jgi:23S rRNA (guanine745-N1)-methyltransferase|uniref:class I SAM-dependent methyltransferase n=1 Tax=Heyndrickxia oleronia TaxID=38875 RepID=UPI0024307012|nr:class I SAM-dependent methyltransferase [Heyndrickxia oleronia]MCI1593109.1 class I SAM-dependent methyltransferase [Heyndrickxia oleronia]MCI1613623.1 class I SAM-dependent methyltransferase [Heyndrickxia oleronia]MCI1761379.1 class I SAM-dependent methyltransferase [Heyndrickxia oleronia]
MKLLDPSTFPDWVSPHSVQWYEQLSSLQGKYEYPWNSIYSEPNGETTFDKEVARMIKEKKVLDIGCGHGEFTMKCSHLAKEITGFDMTDRFIKVGNENKRPNISFVVGNSKDPLPFDQEAFDCAYNRKGPTSSYLSLKQVVKSGGEILGLHPSDEMGKELPQLFPNFFSPSQGTPILNTLKQRLEQSHFSFAVVEIVNSLEYLQSPIDVIKYRCFGQNPNIFHRIKEENIDEITRIFKQNTSENGLPITFSHYIVRAVV